MTKLLRYLILLVSFLLLANLSADAQKLRRMEFQKRQRAAMREYARINPEAVKKLQREFDLTPFDDKRSSVLKEWERTLRSGTPTRKQIVEFSRKVSEIARRDVILGQLGEHGHTDLDGLYRDERGKTQLESHLEKLGVTDHEVVAKSFDVENSKVMSVTLSKEVTLLRIFGGDSKPIGRYLFCCLEHPENARLPIRSFSGDYAKWTDASGLATPPGNLLKDLALVRVPAGTEVIVGVVADNFTDAAGNYKLGGNTQFFLPKVRDFPYQHYRFAAGRSNASDIIVIFDDNKILRFRRGPSLNRIKR